jgi:hypothetical protein
MLNRHNLPQRLIEKSIGIGMRNGLPRSSGFTTFYVVQRVRRHRRNTGFPPHSADWFPFKRDRLFRPNRFPAAAGSVSYWQLFFLVSFIKD